MLRNARLKHRNEKSAVFAWLSFNNNTWSFYQTAEFVTTLISGEIMPAQVPMTWIDSTTYDSNRGIHDNTKTPYHLTD